MSKSKIEWTERTWNPVRGCTRVSEGCRNCYAERFAARYSAPGEPFHGFAESGPPRWTGLLRLIESKLNEPLGWRKPSLVFVNSMSDLFHERLTDESIGRVFAVMNEAKQHTFQVLTKRAKRMRKWANSYTHEGRYSLPPNVWLGVSVEDQKTADERIPYLLATPGAALRWVSYEPALAEIDFYRFFADENGDLTNPSRLEWIVVGGESGPGARSFNPAWARQTILQCHEAGVRVFVKQLGARPDNSPLVRERKGGDPAEWPEDLRVREFPENRAERTRL